MFLLVLIEVVTVSLYPFAFLRSGPGGKPEILFDVADELIDKVEVTKESPAKGIKDKGLVKLGGEPPKKIPKEHRFAITDISHQHLAIFSHARGNDFDGKLPAFAYPLLFAQKKKESQS